MFVTLLYHVQIIKHFPVVFKLESDAAIRYDIVYLLNTESAQRSSMSTTDEMTSIDYEHFQSPFSWRYGSEEMRRLWSEAEKRRLWRRIWVEIARAQARAGIVTPAQVTDLEAHQDAIDVKRALEIEARIHHDLMAEVRVFAEQCPVGGGIIHLGATSADIEDNADALRLRQALSIIMGRLRTLLEILSEQIRTHADLPVMAWTHLQPAEPTTLGYRFALYAQDLLDDYIELNQVYDRIRGKGLKGAVGTGAAYEALLSGTAMTAADLERAVMDALGLPVYPVSGQVYPRKQDYRIGAALASLAGSLSKFAFDLRLLQSPSIGELSEPFAIDQVGSSAMPFKRNPIHAEKIDSLGRLVISSVSTLWDNATLSLLERTLDDSANRREVLPVIFLAVDEMLLVTQRILRGLRIDEGAARANLQRYGVFSAVERVLMAAARSGADRQRMHEHLRELSLKAWDAVTSGQSNPLARLIAESAIITSYLQPQEIAGLLDIAWYVGDAPARARAFADRIDASVLQG